MRPARAPLAETGTDQFGLPAPNRGSVCSIRGLLRKSHSHQSSAMHSTRGPAVASGPGLGPTRARTAIRSMLPCFPFPTPRMADRMIARNLVEPRRTSHRAAGTPRAGRPFRATCSPGIDERVGTLRQGFVRSAGRHASRVARCVRRLSGSVNGLPLYCTGKRSGGDEVLGLPAMQGKVRVVLPGESRSRAR